jgi:hypothetical protein
MDKEVSKERNRYALKAYRTDINNIHPRIIRLFICHLIPSASVISAYIMMGASKLISLSPEILPVIG